MRARRRSPAGRARSVRQPRQGAGRDRGRLGHREQRHRAQGVGDDRGECGFARDAGASLRVARRREARGGARSFRLRSAAAVFASTSAPPPAASRKCCWNAAPEHLYAIDVGRGQLHAIAARAAPKSFRLKKPTSAHSPLPACATPPDLIVIDVSFISLKLVLPAALALAKPPAQLVALIKPQFEAGRAPAQTRHRARRKSSRRGLRRYRQPSSPRSAGASSASSPRLSPAATAMRNFCWAPRRD